MGVDIFNPLAQAHHEMKQGSRKTKMALKLISETLLRLQEVFDFFPDEIN